MESRDALSGQFRAALDTLDQCVMLCPEEHWLSDRYVYPSWQVAFHTAFFAHLYLADNSESFTRWEHHRGELQSLDKYKAETDATLRPDPYSRAQVREYIAMVRESLGTRLAATPFTGPSGFEWLPMTRLEAHIYNIRHIQHHAAQLVDRLRNDAGIEPDWIGTVRA